MVQSNSAINIFRSILGKLFFTIAKTLERVVGNQMNTAYDAEAAMGLS